MNIKGDVIFGAFDGMTSSLGVLVATGLHHPRAVFLAGDGLAIAGTIGMAGGEWLADNGKSRRAAIAIGLGTGVGTLVPVLPYLVAQNIGAFTASLLLALIVGGMIALLRGGKPRDWWETFVILLTTVAVTGGVSSL